ncbi:MAG: V-type ATP synthase subunit I [Spirochaetaceae bacterium]|nr:V-type ATP synthase subunit I [Spirochaetaceae bacterium]
MERDVDEVIEYLGRQGLLHLSLPEENGSVEKPEDSGYSRLNTVLANLREAALYLGSPIADSPGQLETTTTLPKSEDIEKVTELTHQIKDLQEKQNNLERDKKKTADTIDEIQAFAHLKAPFKEIEQLSFISLRIGRLENISYNELKANIGDRFILAPIEGTNAAASPHSTRIIAASSRKGRFALDSELKKYGFTEISIPKDIKGVPSELIAALESKFKEVSLELGKLEAEKRNLAEMKNPEIYRLSQSLYLANEISRLKASLQTYGNFFKLKGWIPASKLKDFVEGLKEKTEGRTAITAFNPEEVDSVREGREKVPVSLKHSAFVKGFEPVIFSYGAPLYGSIDPTPFTAFFFTLLFGIMFGDAGQGAILLLLGILTGKHGLKFMARWRKFSIPLVAVGCSSIVMGLLCGSFFCNETLLAPIRVLHLMPEKGNVAKLFYFFGFTIAIGVVLNSIGLVINIINSISQKKWHEGLFSKTGLAGLFFFWYAISIAIRIILGGSFMSFDIVFLVLPVLLIISGPVLSRLIERKRPLFAEGAMVFAMEGFVEVLETISTYISNTVSFLRVGAFALSHAVLAFIVFTMADLVHGGAIGFMGSGLIMIIGNAIIIALEGMIVAIQVMRLQYYEFFSKFFTETGVEYKPFRI